MSKLHKALRDQRKSTQQIDLQIYGSLGIPINGQKAVEVENRQSYVYVRLRDNQNEVVQAFNNKVAASYNLPVILKREGNRYIVLGVNTQRYENNWNNSAPYLPKHGPSHSFPKGGGGDIVWMFENQIMPALIYPSNVTGSVVNMYEYPFLSQNNTWKTAGNTGTQDILNYRPITGAMSLMALVYLDAVTGNPGVLVNSGTYFPQDITGSNVYQYLPVPAAHQIPLAGIRLSTGTSSISWPNIYGVRQWLQPVSTGTSNGGGGGGSGFVAVQDEGVPLGNASILNFRGPTTQATMSGTVANIYVSGSTQYDIFNGTSLTSSEIADGDFLGILDQSNGFIVAKTAYSQLKESLRLFFNNRYQPSGSVAKIQDDGVPQGTAYTFDFGSNLTASVSGTSVRVDASGGAGSFTGIPIYKDGVIIATGTAISFEQNLNVYVTGTTVFVNAPITTYLRVGQPSFASSPTGLFWTVPDRVYASGSLGVFVGGHALIPGIDYIEYYWTSGTYKYLTAQPTGSYHLVHYGVPCSPQLLDMAYWLTDSESELLTDSDGVQLSEVDE